MRARSRFTACVGSKIVPCEIRKIVDPRHSRPHQSGNVVCE
jgi:hypothetical protein